MFTIDWELVKQELEDNGFCKIENVINKEDCDNLINHYDDSDLYRNTINMERYRFGIGEYKYFHYPLSDRIKTIREYFYTNLSFIANDWNQKIKLNNYSYPKNLYEFLRICNENQQTKATPLILKYTENGYNCLHQDIYGEVYFPFQLVVSLSEREEYQGGENIFVKQIPRAQSRGYSVSLNKGDGIIFSTKHCPIKGKKGYYKGTLKHGVSTILSGERYGLGVTFHDAQ